MNDELNTRIGKTNLTNFFLTHKRINTNLKHLRSTVSKKKNFFFEILINLIIFLDSTWVIYRAKCKQFGG